MLHQIRQCYFTIDNILSLRAKIFSPNHFLSNLTVSILPMMFYHIWPCSIPPGKNLPIGEGSTPSGKIISPAMFFPTGRYSVASDNLVSHLAMFNPPCNALSHRTMFYPSKKGQVSAPFDTLALLHRAMFYTI
jgi:hypothetical protein